MKNTTALKKDFSAFSWVAVKKRKKKNFFSADCKMTSRALNHSYTHMGYGAGFDKFKSGVSRANQFAKDNQVISKGFQVAKVFGKEPRTKIGKGAQNLVAQAGYGKKKKRQTGKGVPKVKVPKSITIKLG